MAATFTRISVSSLVASSYGVAQGLPDEGAIKANVTKFLAEPLSVTITKTGRPPVTFKSSEDAAAYALAVYNTFSYGSETCQLKFRTREEAIAVAIIALLSGYKAFTILARKPDFFRAISKVAESRLFENMNEIWNPVVAKRKEGYGGDSSKSEAFKTQMQELKEKAKVLLTTVAVTEDEYYRILAQFYDETTCNLVKAKNS